MTSAPRRWIPYVQAAALVLHTLAIYRDVPRFGLQREWDDGLVLLGRPEATHWLTASWRDRLLTPAMGYPTPLPTLLQFVTMHRGGPSRTHVLSLLVHLANVLLAWALVARWSRRRALAFVVAALWAAHPLLVESVVWLTDLKRLLASAAVLAGALLWEDVLERGRARDAILAVVALAVGLASHPLALALAAFVLLRTIVAGAPALRARGARGGLAAMALLVALYVPLGVLPYRGFLERANDAAVVEAAHQQRVPHAAQALALQTRHTVWPSALYPAYTARYAGSDFDVALGAVAALALAVGLVAAWRRRLSAAIPLLFAAVFYLPSSGITVTPRFLADSFAYLPLLGVIAAGAMALPSVRPSGAAAAVVICLVAVLAWRSERQAARWQNAVTLWEPLITAAPNYSRSYEIVAGEYAAQGDWKRAASIYDRGYRALRSTGALTTRMAAVYRQAGDPVKAADVAMVVFATSRGADTDAARFLVETLVSNGIPLPPAEAARALVRSAAETSAPSFARPEERSQIAAYFRAQGAPEVAAIFER